MVRELSIHQEHELLKKLEDAGLEKDLAQAIINSPDNTLAKQIINYLSVCVATSSPKGHKPIKKEKETVITAQQRNRQEILNDTTKYVLGRKFKKILAKCTTGKTVEEVFHEDELYKYKSDKDIIKEMKISELAPDQIAERIIQLGQITKWTIIGYCNRSVVSADSYGDGRTYVYASGFGFWQCSDSSIANFTGF